MFVFMLVCMFIRVYTRLSWQVRVYLIACLCNKFSILLIYPFSFLSSYSVQVHRSNFSGLVRSSLAGSDAYSVRYLMARRRTGREVGFLGVAGTFL